MSKMNRFKFDAFVQEFPFLEKVFNNLRRESCDNITVERIDVNLLQTTPYQRIGTGSRVGINNYEQIDFVLENGDIIHNAVKDKGYANHNAAHTDDESWDGETILEAIDRHNIAHRLLYIVKVEQGYNIVNHHSRSNWRATIYKPAKDDTIADLLDKVRQQAEAEVKAEATF